MSDVLTKIVVDCSTGAVKELPLTAEEVAQREADEKAYAEAKAQKEAEIKAKAVAKAAIAERLGLSADELVILLG